MEPNIRVKGFDDDWKERSLGEIFTFQNGFNGGKEVYGSGVPLISVMDVLDDDFITYDKIRGKAEVSEEEHERFSVKYGDVLFQRSSENVEDAGTSNVYLDPDHTAVFGGFVIRGRGIAEYDPTFMKYCLSTPMVRTQFMKKAQGAQHVNISQEVLQGIQICEPSGAEQARISEMFSCLGQQISLQQQKVAGLKELKKCMLQKMFPKDGEKVPEIRFAGFEGEWEQRKLGEMSSSFEYGLNAAATEYDGENKYIRITDIADDSREFKQDDVTSPDTDLSKADNYRLSEGDILFARTGASVGKTYIYNASDGLVYYAGFLIRARINEKYNPEFIFQNTLTSEYEKFIRITSMRSGQPGVNAQEYSQFAIMVPGKPEQDKIAHYLRSLDSLITQHQRKHDTLLEFKAYLLQNMFPKEG